MPRAWLTLTTLAMLAFAANSLLCRIALTRTDIDPASFTTIRLASGALVLWLVVQLRNRAPASGNSLSAIALTAYAVGFSFAYVRLPAAAGALLLFGAVQVTMIGYGYWRGERLQMLQLGGLTVALAGLLTLLLPGLSTPPLAASILMLAAGAAWGVYSLRGRAGGDPTSVTAGNFLLSVPIALAINLLLSSTMQIDAPGAIFAIASGALTSGLGYVVWYSALPALSATQAATVQLSVPVIAAVGGIVFLGEPLTWRLVAAAIAILGGIALVIHGAHRNSRFK